MSQAVIAYIWFASDVLLICWFGTQLTQHVRQNKLVQLLLTLLKHMPPTAERHFSKPIISTATAQMLCLSAYTQKGRKETLLH